MNQTFATELLSNVSTKSGRKGLNSKCANLQWWANSKERTTMLTSLVHATAFLPDSSSIPERIYTAVNGLSQSPRCYCGKSVSFKSFSEGYATYCSPSCATSSPDRNSKISQHRDTSGIIKKTCQTNQQKYGVDWTTQLPTMKNKTAATKQLRYGSALYNNHSGAIQTNLSRYGVKYIGQSEQVKQRNLETRSKHLPELRDINWLIETNKTKSPYEMAQLLNVTPKTIYDWFAKHNITPNYHTPKRRLEPRIAKELETLDVPFLQNVRNIIAPKELDFYFPSHKVAIEINGCYWHAEDATRHLQKHQMCETNGIRLLQFWDFEWLEHADICLSIISQVLGKTPHKIGARKCKIVNLATKAYQTFLNQHHLMGYAPASHKVGLMFQNELVAVMGIGTSRFGSGDELIRFACRTYTHVSGGFSRLLKTYTGRTLWSYTDKRLFTGSGYARAGFQFHHLTPPSYFYFKKNERKNRIACQKHKLAAWLPEFNTSLTEHQNMNNHGWKRVYDCGQSVWIYRT